MFFSKKNTPFEKWCMVLCLENWTFGGVAQCPATQRWVTDELIRALTAAVEHNPALDLLDSPMQRRQISNHLTSTTLFFTKQAHFSSTSV
jgi:hypothetical protein